MSKSLETEWTFEKPLLHALTSGTDVRPYGSLGSRQFVLFPYEITAGRARLHPMDAIIKRQPKTAEYLRKNRTRLEARERGKLKGTDRWHGYIYLKNMAKQDTPKICVPRLVEVLNAAPDFDGSHFLDNVDVGGVAFKMDYASHSLGYLLALLNSRLLRWFFPFVSAPFRGGWRSANKQFLSLVPLYPIDFTNKGEKAEHDTIVKLVQKITAAKTDDPDADTVAWEREIDERVYRLYGLTKAEIAIVEGDAAQ